MTDEWLEKFEADRAERDTGNRTFSILDEDLTVKTSVAPEIAIRLNAMRQAVRSDLEAAKAAEEAGEELPKEHVTTAQMLATADETVLGCLDPASHDAWRRLRDPDHPAPLRFVEIFSLCDYLLGRASGHPTVGPDDSSNGPTGTGASSTAESSSPAAVSKR